MPDGNGRDDRETVQAAGREAGVLVRCNRCGRRYRTSASARAASLVARCESCGGSLTIEADGGDQPPSE